MKIWQVCLVQHFSHIYKGYPRHILLLEPRPGAVKMNWLDIFTDLPAGIFLIIIQQFLEPLDIVRCRGVSVHWYYAFTNLVFLRAALLWKYPQARETGSLKALGELKCFPDTGDIYERGKWMHIFDRVAARYQSLSSRKPRSVTNVLTFHEQQKPIQPFARRLGKKPKEYLQFQHQQPI